LTGTTPILSMRRVCGYRRVWRAAHYSFKGLRSVWKREAAFRQEIFTATLLMPVTFFAAVTKYERCALLLSLVFVLIVELLNSALEAVVDLSSPGLHPLAALAKDAGSAAVLLSLVSAAAIWVSILT